MAEPNDKLIRMPTEAFLVFELSLPDGHRFDPNQSISAWSVSSGLGYGALLAEPGRKYRIIVLRRRDDYVLVPSEFDGFTSRKEALHQLHIRLSEGGRRLPVPAGVRRRKAIENRVDQIYSELFSELSTTITYRGAFHIIAELYLALPKPDDNFLSDFETYGFNARLWELYLFACFKEQGCTVLQDYPSPDFEIVSGQHRAFIEAVTANPTGPGMLKLQQTQPPL